MIFFSNSLDHLDKSSREFSNSVEMNVYVNLHTSACSPGEAAQERGGDRQSQGYEWQGEEFSLFLCS